MSKVSIDQLGGTNYTLNLFCTKCKIRNWRHIRTEQYSNKFGSFYWKCKDCNSEYITRFHIMQTHEFLGFDSDSSHPEVTSNPL